MRGLLQDFRYALRSLRKSPSFSAIAILTLALGIGANAVVLAVVQSVLIAPLPYRDADRIVALNTKFISEARSINRVTGADLMDVKAQSGTFEQVAYYYGGEMGVQLPEHAAFTGVQGATANFAQVFGVQPVVGHLYSDEEASHSALINANFARDNFGSAEAAVGKTLSVEGVIYNIVGVLPAEFSYPKGTQVWMGAPSTPEAKWSHRTSYNFHSVAKVKPGVSMATVQSELDAIGDRLRKEYAAENKDKAFLAVPLHEQLVGKVRPMFLLLVGAVGLILLIACVNVAHLQLARATTRMKEVALRSALGASRLRIVRQVFLESLLLAGVGAGFGLVLAVPLLKAFLRLAPTDIPRLSEVHINAGALLLIALVSILATLLSGVAPAWQMLRLNVNESLKQDSARGLTGRGAAKLRGALVVAEIALTFVLAAGAGLLARTMIKLDATDPGYRRDRMLVMYVHAPAKGLQENTLRTQQMETLFDQLRSVPGVNSVAGVMGLPAGDYGSNGGYQVTGQALPSSLDDLPQANWALSSPQYFSTMGIPLLRGRDFAKSDTYDSEFVAIISEALARQSFGVADPIGKQIHCGWDTDKWMMIVGVVGDVRQDSPASTPRATLYLPLKQHPFSANELQVVVHTNLTPLAVMETARRMVQDIDPRIATKFTTMDSMVAVATAMPRFRSWLVGGFALLGLVLAMLGIYGVMAYTLAQRTFEVGVRMTFGAQRGDILEMVLGRTIRLTVAGLVVGLVLTAIAARFLRSMLFGVPAEDPVSFGAAAVLLTLVALAAAYFPARRAASVDPLAAIRYE
jgi:predicted permease